MNATKHGMTARVVMRPAENAAEFKGRMVGFFAEYRRRTRHSRRRLSVEIARIAGIQAPCPGRGARAGGGKRNSGGLGRGVSQSRCCHSGDH
jgi:hypothetical protein